MTQSTLGVDGCPRKRRTRVRAAALALLVCMFALSASAVSAQAEVTTYSAVQTIPVPPASNFQGSGGGDGWAVALSSTAVYNIFHHQTTMQIACHLQSNAEPCFSPETITDESGNNFSTSGEPGMYLDRKTGKLYVYGTRTNDATAGVVCIDTNLAPTTSDPFCGFTPLTAVGDSPLIGISTASGPMLVGSHWYSFNFANGPQEGTKNTLMCFDVSTDTPCAGEPYAVSIGSGSVSDGGFPSPSTGAVGGKVFIPMNIGGKEQIACFDDATASSCAGSWPTAVKTGYAAQHGAPFPMLDATGATIGICIPTGSDECFNMAGEEVAAPEHLKDVVTGSSPWNGPALQLGPRVYVPNGNSEHVECFDYATGVSCANFPKSFSELGYLYTVNPDPERPTCIWVNADDGNHQIQNFDAYTGEACGQGSIRALASQFVVPNPACTPASYVSLQVLKPVPGVYTTGTIGFDDGDGNPITGLAEKTLDGTGTVSLAGLALNTPTGLPQFLISLAGASGPVGAVEIKLVWTGDYSAVCAGEGVTVAKPVPVTKPAPKGAVLAFGTAHLASSGRACVASARYTASVSGTLISSVTFTVNGRRIARVTKSRHGKYTAAIKVPAGKHEKLVIHIAYTAASKTRAATITRTLARCAARRTTPRFTG